jgi:alcohol dehydrogenase
MPVSPSQLLFESPSVHGHPAGTAWEVEQTLAFAALTGIRTMIEAVPLTDAAYKHAFTGQARFRVVLAT